MGTIKKVEWPLKPSLRGGIISSEDSDVLARWLSEMKFQGRRTAGTKDLRQDRVHPPRNMEEANEAGRGRGR